LRSHTAITSGVHSPCILKTPRIALASKRLVVKVKFLAGEGSFRRQKKLAELIEI
jgi:hypothetical protein